MRPSSLFPSKASIRFAVAMLVVAALAAGCATRRPVPVEDRTSAGSVSPPVMVAPSTPAPPVIPAQPAPVPTYTVKRGDTLHQIALDTGLDYRELAAWNNIENVNLIRVGQVLRLAAPGEAPQIAQESPPGVSATPGVTTAPLRVPPAIVESKPGTSAAPGVVMAPSPGPLASTPAVPAQSPGASGNLKTSPKAIKEPYSDQAVRELTLAASAVPAPPDTLAMAAPEGVRVEPRSEPKPEPRASTPSAAPILETS